MFTGIIQGLGEIVELEQHSASMRMRVLLPTKAQGDIELGASISNNGCCLTVVETDQQSAVFDVIDESLAKTNLGQCQVGSKVNIERAATYASEIGGHMVSGHILTTCEVLAINKDEQNTCIRLSVPELARDYLFTKGFVALNGASLTIGDIDEQGFNVHLIPETLELTNFGTMQVSDLVNLEVDAQIQAVVDTVKRMKQAGQI